MTSAPSAPVDLHFHSTASDGAFAPEEVARRTLSSGLETVALSDHDTTEGLAAFQRAAPGLRVVPAIELTCRVREGSRGTIHLLGYGIDVEHAGLQEAAHTNRLAKRKQIEGILAALAAEEGIEISWDEAAVGRGEDAYVGRHHIAAVLVRRGLARNRIKAFRRFLKSERVPCADVIHWSDAMQAIHGAGGLAVLAHPHHEDLEFHLPALEGLDGLEVYRPRVQAHRARKLAKLAGSKGLLVTGGSDWHGHAPEAPYGTWPGPPPEALDPFLAALGQPKK